MYNKIQKGVFDMTLIVCLDPRNGLLFNNRRQTVDYELVKIIAKDFGKVYISPFSEKYFEGVDCIVSKDPYAAAAPDGTVFIENDDTPATEAITKLIVYRWSTVYPADTYFKLSPEELGLSLRGRVKFSTKVHKDIVKEIYK